MLNLADAEFSWQVTGVRDGFENQEVIVDIDSTGNINETKTLSQKRVDMNEKVKKLMDKRAAGDKKKNIESNCFLIV